MVRLTAILAACVAASAFLIAPADASISTSTRPVAAQRLAQARDVAACARWRADLRSRLDGFNRSCSGPLSPNQAALCETEKRRLDDETSQFNSQCAG